MKKDTRNTERFVRAVDQEDPAKAKDILETVLKEKCAKKISDALKTSK